jgi:hypothetical protein
MNRLRIGLALGGFGLALLGVAYNERRLAWTAMVLLAGSLLLRLWRGKRGNSEGGGEEDSL